MEDPLRLLQALEAPEPLTLTFGVELEFVLRFDPVEYAEKAEEWCSMPEESAWEHMRAVLDKEFPGYNIRERCDQSVPDFEQWSVGTDSSIHIPEVADEERVGYSAIEIRSPALPYTVESLGDLCDVFEMLFSRSDVLVNDTCGLHIHVGNRQKGFPLRTVKNLCTLTSTFEREFESLHPPSRIGNAYCRSSGQLFEGISPWDVERIIKSMRNIDNLISRFQDSEEGYAYNLTNLVGSKQTIESRQHEATVDVEAIVKWVELTCGLVERAHQFATEDYSAIGDHLAFECLDRYLDATYSLSHLTVLDVLVNLGMREVSAYYSMRGLYTHARSAWAWVSPEQESAMTPWLDTEERDERVYGEKISRSVANSEGNQDKYWDAVLECAMDTPIQVPCENRYEFGEKSSRECFCGSWDCWPSWDKE